MTNQRLHPPTTFAGFPGDDKAACTAPGIAVVGIPYLSPYPAEKSYDSQKAPAGDP